MMQINTHGTRTRARGTFYRNPPKLLCVHTYMSVRSSGLNINWKRKIYLLQSHVPISVGRVKKKFSPFRAT